MPTFKCRYLTIKNVDKLWFLLDVLYSFISNIVTNIFTTLLHPCHLIVNEMVAILVLFVWGDIEWHVFRKNQCQNCFNWDLYELWHLTAYTHHVMYILLKMGMHTSAEQVALRYKVNDHAPGMANISHTSSPRPTVVESFLSCQYTKCGQDPFAPTFWLFQDDPPWMRYRYTYAYVKTERESWSKTHTTNITHYITLCSLM